MSYLLYYTTYLVIVKTIKVVKKSYIKNFDKKTKLSKHTFLLLKIFYYLFMTMSSFSLKYPCQSYMVL